MNTGMKELTWIFNVKIDTQFYMLDVDNEQKFPT